MLPLSSQILQRMQNPVKVTLHDSTFSYRVDTLCSFDYFYSVGFFQKDSGEKETFQKLDDDDDEWEWK